MKLATFFWNFCSSLCVYLVHRAALQVHFALCLVFYSALRRLMVGTLHFWAGAACAHHLLWKFLLLLYKVPLWLLVTHLFQSVKWRPSLHLLRGRSLFPRCTIRVSRNLFLFCVGRNEQNLKFCIGSFLDTRLNSHQTQKMFGYPSSASGLANYSPPLVLIHESLEW